MIDTVPPQRPPGPATAAGETGTGIADPPLPFTGGRIPASEDERKLVERRVRTQFSVSPALSMAALVAGFQLGRPHLAALGVIGLGLDALWIGALAVGERRLMFMRGGMMVHREYRSFVYEGLAAVPYGLAYLVCGACLVAPALLFLGGTSLEQMRAAVLARPLVPHEGLGLAAGRTALGTEELDAAGIGCAGDSEGRGAEAEHDGLPSA